MHRDIKPENLLVADVDTVDPVLKLCDFGTARDEGDMAADGKPLTHYVGSRCEAMGPHLA